MDGYDVRGVKQLGWAPFPGRLWQRNCYEHIIRNERECNALRDYILNNPFHWTEDQLNSEKRPVSRLPVC